jgi:hypothetical protein
VDNPGVGQLPLLNFRLSLETSFFLELNPDKQALWIHPAVLDHEVTISTADLHLQLIEASVQKARQVLGLQ